MSTKVIRHSLTESKTQVLQLEPEQARLLQAVGRRLASDKTWWGASERNGDHSERTVIRCRPRGADQYAVRVSNAVGIVSIGDLQIEVSPKIPTSHLLYLFAASGRFPRLDEQTAEVGVGSSLHELLAEWFVNSTEVVLRRDLMRDYSQRSAFLFAKRGRIDIQATARSYYRGRIGLQCEFAEFNRDTPLNRLLLAGARSVARRVGLRRDLRHRARRLITRFDGVGALRPRDDRARIVRQTAHYRDAVPLARQVLRWQGRLIEHGEEKAWTFLIRTPEMVEEGIRKVIRKGLSLGWNVEKRGIKLTGSNMTLTPDLVFNEGQLVGDVKYKLLKKDWNRTDLYQLAAFTEAYRATLGILVGFLGPERRQPRTVSLGDLSLLTVCWPADPLLTPEEAADSLSTSLNSTLASDAVSQARSRCRE